MSEDRAATGPEKPPVPWTTIRQDASERGLFAVVDEAMVGRKLAPSRRRLIVGNIVMAVAKWRESFRDCGCWKTADGFSLCAWHERVFRPQREEAERLAAPHALDVDALAAVLPQAIADATQATYVDGASWHHAIARNLRALLAGDKAEAPRESTHWGVVSMPAPDLIDRAALLRGVEKLRGLAGDVQVYVDLILATPRAATEPDPRIWDDGYAQGFATAQNIAAATEPLTGFTVERWIDSLHENHNGLVWITKAELRAALHGAEPAPSSAPLEEPRA